MYYRRTTSEMLFRAGNYIFLTVLGAATFYPFWYIIVNSISDPVSGVGAMLWPKDFYWANYWIVVNTPGVWRALAITVLRVATGVPLMLIVTGTAAFALTRKELLGRKILILFFFMSLFFEVGLIPYYMVLRSFGLINTFWVYIIPSGFSVWTMIVMKTSFQGLPDGLTEAARMDGAGYTRIFFGIVVPLSLPMFAVLGLFGAVTHWNDYFTGEFYVNTKPKLWPLQTFLRLSRQNAIDVLKGVILQKDQGGTVQFNDMSDLEDDASKLTQRSLDMAFTVFAMAPVLLAYPWLQRYFVKGVLIGSIKE